MDLFPVLAGIQSTFLNLARAIQSGGPEFIPSEVGLNVWWPADEYVLIELWVENKLQKFYEESELPLTRLFDGTDVLPPGLLKPESTEGRPWGQPLKKLEGAPLNLG